MERFWATVGQSLSAIEAPFESRRVFHGRGRTVPGLEFLNCDLFHPLLLVTMYEPRPEPWWTEFGARANQLASTHSLEAVVVQRRDLPEAPAHVVVGTIPAEVSALQGQLRYALSIARGGRNTGFFLDMATAHSWTLAHSAGRNVLNLFAYTCAFSTAAIAGGAVGVVNIDMSKRALGIGRTNHQANGLDTRRANYLAHDIFKSWGKLKRLGPYDLVVIDPPSYQYKSFVTDQDYPRVLRRLESLTRPGSQVLAALNSPDHSEQDLHDFFAQSAPDFAFVERLAPAPGFVDIDPDRSLKVLLFERVASG
ncbi:MAG: 23S rRNA (cytosine1962-C5)-methyltransferase [Myxococcota bacterium]|jgi:23S rRNA (cytosine1962-C5)-methyltransferase